MNMQTTPVEPSVPKPASPPVQERIEISEAELKFLAECEAAYKANPTELYTWDEVLAYVNRRNSAEIGI